MKLNGMLKLCAVGLLFTCSSQLYAQQLKLGTNPTQITKSALLELNSNSQGLLLNRVPLSQLSGSGTLASAPDGMMVFVDDATEKSLFVRKGNSWKKVVDLGNITIVQSFNTRTGDVLPLAGDYASFYAPLSRNLSINSGNAALTIDVPSQNLNADRTWTITANNTNPLWNANALYNIQIDNSTAPVEGDLIRLVSGKWKSVSNTTILNNTTGTPQAATINISGPATFSGLMKLSGPINSTADIVTTQTVSTSILNATGNITTGGSLILSNYTAGSVPFIGTSKALAENNSKFFWDITNARLGVGNNAPANVLEVSPATITTPPSNVSGLRLTGLGSASPAAASNKVLSVNANGDVIVQDNTTYLNWAMSGNGNATTASFLGTTSDIDMVVKYNNKELFRGSKGNNGYSNYSTVLFNGAKPYNAHPFIVRANGNDIMAFQDSTGTIKYHWNSLGGGLNFVESNIADYRIFMRDNANGGGVGIDTNTPTATLSVNGSFSTNIRSTGSSITLADNDHTLILTATGLTITLPAAAASNKGREYVIKMGIAPTGNNTPYTFILKGSGTQTIDTGGNTITIGNGSNSASLKYGAMTTVQSDGTKWWIIGY
ncbi:hypothetical protein CLV59_103179 [Chitinophaga dinghuensis]|uniref:Uncharacterized protein n=1 Tax=Chitinophaga dinghuensis TaxID=1539050 RepID=A0A327WAX9_9BACT|nr:hypothetical protein [Chitinophaga dinghuensis]RAJ83218.1 hypothetical protein CLV59_103179 [Chitinophaga dinghuensis]